MILSSPFSRQNRNHQTWSSANGPRQPATPTSNGFSSFGPGNANRKAQLTLTLPASSASARVAPSERTQNGLPAMRESHYQAQPVRQQAQSSLQNSQQPIKPQNTNFRSHTLNRLDVLRARQRQQHEQHQQIKRNLSALGHSSSHVGLVRGETPNGWQPRDDQSEHHYKQPATSGSRRAPPLVAAKQQVQPIYAPVSIACPEEYNKARPGAGPRLQNQYSSTLTSNFLRGDSVNVSDELTSTTSTSARSGRESALGAIWERFGTLRRRAKWSSSRSSSAGSKAKASGSSPRSIDGAQISGRLPSTERTLPSNKPPEQVSTLDPEIYATGKREVPAEEIYAEGSRAIDGNSRRRLLEHHLDESLMTEGETRTLIDQESRLKPEFKQITTSLKNWINDELSLDRIIVKDLQDDLYDGQILGRLFEKLQGVKLDIVEVTQNEQTQKHKLRMVLEAINRMLSIQARWARIRWTVEGIHGKNLVEIIYLLNTLALYYRAPIRIPENVRVRVDVVQKVNNQLVRRSHEALLTDSNYAPNQFVSPYSTTTLDRNMIGRQKPQQQYPQKDVFDTLVESGSSDKLSTVSRTLVSFVNRHLSKVNMTCQSSRLVESVPQHNSPADYYCCLDPNQFSDGLLLVFLIASLEGYFVPLGNLFTAEPEAKNKPPCKVPDRLDELNRPTDRLHTLEEEEETGSVHRDLNNNNTGIHETALEPDSYINTQPIHKLHNVNVALRLIEEAGIDVRSRGVKAEDIVNGDLRSLLRVLYALFSRYKHL